MTHSVTQGEGYTPHPPPRTACDRNIVFTTPIRNDFQWRNLYLKQYGTCTYAPPLQRDPSTTTSAFPKRKDVAFVLGDLGSDGEEDYTTVKATQHGALSRQESFFNMAGYFSDEVHGADGDAISPTASPHAHEATDSPSVAATAASVNGGAAIRASGNASSRSFAAGQRPRSKASPTALDILMADGTLDPSAAHDEDDVLFNGAFFGFLGQRPNARGGGGGGSSAGASSSTHDTTSGTWTGGEAMLPGLPLLSYRHQMNPHRIPGEVFSLHKDAWTLLMDNRAMGWLEREAREKGRTAAQVRRRLLELITNPQYTQQRSSGSPLLGSTTRASRGSNGVAVPTGVDATVQVNETSPTPAAASPSNFAEQLLEAPLLSEDVAQQRIYEGFQPFFAVISPPSILRRLRDQFNASRRAQMRGMPGTAADIVGFPLFSQFATWREAYEHRRTWEGTPFSFFLIHDASYNYAHVSALYVMLQNIAAATHTHNPSRCLAHAETIMLEDATHLLTHSRSIRRAAERQRNLCPLLAIQQVTEDVLLAFEQSSSRTTLTMAMHVLSFLTDLVLDAETAARFLSPDALHRQSSATIPGMPVVQKAPAGDEAKDLSPRGSPRLSPRVGSPTFTQAERTAQGGGCGRRFDADGDDNDDGATCQGGENSEGPSATAAAPTLPEGLAPKRFSDADFEALFSLSFWFIDAATAHSRVPVDPSLLPARPRPTGHPEQQNLSPSQTPEMSLSFGSNHSTRLGSAGSKSLRRQSPRNLARLSARSRGREAGASGRRSPRAASAHSGGSVSPPSPTSLSGGFNGGMEQHQYIPGRQQIFNAVNSLVDVIILHDAQRQATLEAQEREAHRAAEVAAAQAGRRRSKTSVFVGPEPTTTTARKPATLRKRSNSVGRGSRVSDRESIARMTVNLSPSTTLLATPLVFITTYIRLHGAPWLKNLFGRLFNVLRRESVLLYVNRLDLEAPQLLAGAPAATPTTTGRGHALHSPGISPSARHRPPSASQNSSNGRPSVLSQSALSPQFTTSGSSREHTGGATRARQNSISVRSGGTSAQSAFRPSVASPAGAAQAPSEYATLELDDAFYARMERLEDLVCQDILYVLQEFFSALHGKRSATRLPQGITSLLTQFTSMVHLHLLGNVILTSETVAEFPGAAARKVSESLARLKQKRMAGKAFRTEHVSDVSVSRLIRSIEQFRLTKFILFDCWIIPALNNAVAMGYLSEGSSMHLRWNIDAFARYLKILVNAPFLEEHYYEEQRKQTASSAGVSTEPRSPGPTNASGDGSPLYYTKEPGSSSAHGRRRRRTRDASPPITPPTSLPLPRYITGIYDVSSGSLVHVRRPGEAFAATPSSPVGNDASVVAQNKSQTMIPDSRGPAGIGKGTDDPLANPSSPPMPITRSPRALKAGSRGTGGGLPPRRAPSLAGSISTQGGVSPSARVTRAVEPVYTVMDSCDWEGISSAMKGLNEALGIVGYDPEDLVDLYSAAGGTRTSHTPRGSVHDTMSAASGGSFGDNSSAMRVLDMFCRRASVENAHNVVVSEFEVLPTMAAGCVDKVHEMMKGEHPLVEHALATGVLPNSFGSSPYLACLHGVLLHPKTAARALDNVYYNANRFYQALMRPVRDEGLLSLVSALVVDQDDLPVVDSNALLPLLASVPAVSSTHPRPLAGASAANAGTSLPSLRSTAPPPGSSFMSVRSQAQSASASVVMASHTALEANQQEHLTAHARWEAEARKLKHQRLFLATGAVQGNGLMSTVMAALDRVGPPDPQRVLAAGSARIEQEARVVPACFDPWWRAMALALCVKAMGVFEECGTEHAEAFEQWFAEKTDHAYRDNRRQRDAFIRQKGRLTEGPETEKASRASARGSGAASGTRSGSTGPSGGGAGSSTAKRGKRRTVSKKRRIGKAVAKGQATSRKTEGSATRKG